MMKKIVVLFVLFGIALFIGASAASASLIENGDFELGLASWDHSPNVKVKGSWANINPKSGDRQAVMSPVGFLPSSLTRIKRKPVIAIPWSYYGPQRIFKIGL